MAAKNKIPWWIPDIGSSEKELVRKVLDDNFPNEGKLTQQFEEKIAGLLGSRHAIAATSGTAALYLSLKALGIGPGDEVVVPDMTFIATANAVDMCGAKPILVDVDARTLNMPPDAFESAVTAQTKAVIPVHVSGRAADMGKILKIANACGIHVVEDAAEGFMSKHNGRCLGTFGVTGCFSFSPNKTITTGQGGMIVTDDDALEVRLRELKDQGRPKRGTGGNDLHNAMGYNFKFTDIQAAVGLGQLNYLDRRLKRMKRFYEIYAEALAGMEGISLYGFDVSGGEVPQWTDAVIEDRDGLAAHLRSQAIGCREFWHPLHTQKPYRSPDSGFPNSTRLSPRSLWLASAFTLAEADIHKVCGAVKQFLEK